ncbi:MAG: hypothetical protein QXY45_02355 [Candidatus Aenigmatarchaeota archaeon]
MLGKKVKIGLCLGGIIACLLFNGCAENKNGSTRPPEKPQSLMLCGIGLRDYEGYFAYTQREVVGNREIIQRGYPPSSPLNIQELDRFLTNYGDPRDVEIFWVYGEDLSGICLGNTISAYISNRTKNESGFDGFNWSPDRIRIIMPNNERCFDHKKNEGGDPENYEEAINQLFLSHELVHSTLEWRGDPLAGQMDDSTCHTPGFVRVWFGIFKYYDLFGPSGVIDYIRTEGYDFFNGYFGLGYECQEYPNPDFIRGVFPEYFP